jgi:hypothetical protein
MTDTTEERAIKLLKRVLKEVVSTPYRGTYHALPNGPLRNDIRDFLEMLGSQEIERNNALR